MNFGSAKADAIYYQIYLYFYRLTMMKNFMKAPATGAQRLDVLQVMRAVAAVVIVALHADVNWEFTLFPLRALRLGGGVDLFFVISGFVISYASRPYFAAAGGRSAFLLRRFPRIVPLYWFVLTVRLAMAAVATIIGAKAFPPKWSNLVYLVIVISTVAIVHAFHVFVETPANLWLRDRLITSPRKVVVS